MYLCFAQHPQLKPGPGYWDVFAFSPFEIIRVLRLPWGCFCLDPQVGGAMSSSAAVKLRVYIGVFSVPKDCRWHEAITLSVTLWFIMHLD